MRTKVRKKDTGEAGNKGEFGTIARGEVDVSVPIGEPEFHDEYTFLAHFEKLEEQYEQDFEGFPSRFFNADLRGKFLPPPGSPDEMRYLRANHATGVPQRLYLAVSDTSDLRIDDDQVHELAKRCGIENLTRLDPDVATRLRLNGTRAWVGWKNGKQIALSDASAGTKNARAYRFRSRPVEPFTDHFFTHLDLRALAANERIKRRTGVDVLPIAIGEGPEERIQEFLRTVDERPQPEFATLADGLRSGTDAERRSLGRVLDAMTVGNALSLLEDAQLEGRNFQAQRRFLREKRSSIATAWQDKKHPDREHEEMMRSTVLNDSFRKVEIDNDVDAESYARFEQAWEETRAKLPSIPDGKEPTLRIRKLGKHRASGVFFPHVNTIAVDVRDSGSMIHEYGHYIDTVAQNNASLGADFREVVGAYSKRLQVPPGTTGKHNAAYYCTPTEVYARAFEIYAHERLGVDNRLLHPEKFEDFAYAPISRDPELKAKIFGLFDAAFDR